MRKIVFLTGIFLIAGCAGTRRAGPGGTELKSNEVTLNGILNQNLSKESFYIQKANIEVENESTTLNFVATIKFLVPDEYLISLRLKSGIELARIYLNSDTIMANDRINKVFYIGKPSFLATRYGVPFDIVPAIFGDLIIDYKEGSIIKCQNGKGSAGSVVKGLKISYEVDCGRGKVLSMKQEGSFSEVKGEMVYDKFEKHANKNLPTEVTIMHHGSGSNLKLKFEKIETPWNGIIEFIPGSRYKKVELR